MQNNPTSVEETERDNVQCDGSTTPTDIPTKPIPIVFHFYSSSSLIGHQQYIYIII